MLKNGLRVGLIMHQFHVANSQGGDCIFLTPVAGLKMKEVGVGSPVGQVCNPGMLSNDSSEQWG